MINFVHRVAALAEQACAFVQRVLVSIVMQDYTMVNGAAATGLKLLRAIASLAHVLKPRFHYKLMFAAKTYLFFPEVSTPM
jgi:hypothetical protein